MEGKVDGVQTRVRALVYRKNDCAYVLTFVALPKSLVADTANKPAATGDLAEFSKFISPSRRRDDEFHQSRPSVDSCRIRKSGIRSSAEPGRRLAFISERSSRRLDPAKIPATW
jgi:hypothetical protein